MRTSLTSRLPDPSVVRATPRYAARPVVMAGFAAGAVVVVWAVTCLAYFAHVAWLLPMLILVGTASLLRTGGSLLGRLLLAAGALIGALCVGGLLFSLWPWRMHPIALSGFALTALVLTSVLTGRRPTLPRPSLGDGLSVLNGLLAGVVVAWPVLRLDPVSRLAVAAGADDLGRQFALFDVVRRLGGYLYGAGDPGGLLAYPQGASLVYGTLDGFVRSAAGQSGTGLESLDHYLAWLAAGYAFLAVVLTWGVQRLAAPALSPVRRLVLVTTVAVALLMTGLFRLAVSGYPGEVLGLAAAALLVVLVCRPGGSSAETLLLASALVATVGFVFPPYLPAALLMAGIWVGRRWTRVRRHAAALGVLILAALVGSVVALIGLAHGRGMPAIAGNPRAGGEDAFMILTAVLLVGLFGRAPVRSAIWRSFAYCVGAVGGGYILVLTAERLAGSAVHPTTDYYYFGGAVLRLLLGLAVLGLGSVLWLRPAARHRAQRRPTPQAQAAVAGAALVMVGAAWGIVLGDSAASRAVVNRMTVVPWQYTHGQLADTVAAALVETARAESVPGAVTVVLAEDWRTAQRAQDLVAALERSPATLAVSAHLDDGAEEAAILRRYESLIAGLPGPVVLVVDSDGTAERAQRIEDRFGARVVGVFSVAG